MAASSLDILNLSHSLKDLCEVNCKCPDCLSRTLQTLLQYNLIQANLSYGRQFGPPLFPCETCAAGHAEKPEQALPQPKAPALQNQPCTGLNLSNALVPEHRP